MHLREQHVRGERDKPANGISPGDGQCAAKSSRGSPTRVNSRISFRKNRSF